MLVHSIGLEVTHHVCNSSLGGRLRAFLVSTFTSSHIAVNLVKILLSSWIQLACKVLLSLQRSRLGFGYLINLETRTHSRMHDNLSWCLYLLKTVERDVIQI